MRARIMNTCRDGMPLAREVEVFAGKSTIEVVQAMRREALFSDRGTFEDEIDMVLSNAKGLAGVDLVPNGY